MTTVTLWRNRNFRRIWGAGTIGATGAEIGELALPVLALVTIGATAEELSWVRTATFLPYLLLTLWVGVLVDRQRRRPLMVTAECVSGLVLLTVAVMALIGLLTIETLVAAAFVLGAMSVVHTLADFSFLPQVVDREQLPTANAHVTATQSVIGVAGSGVGGALVQVLTAPVAVALNGVSRLVAATLLSRVSTIEQPPPAQSGSPVKQAIEGLTTLLRHRVVRALAAEATVWNLGSEIFTLALTVAIISNRSDGPLALGLVLGAGGVGAALGATISARLTDRFGYGHSLIAALLLGNTAPLIGVLCAPDTTLTSLITLGGAYLVSGLGIGVANSQAVTVRQLTVPEPQRGRVNAAYRLLSWGALSVGAILAGLATNQLGTHTAAVLGTALMALSTLPVALSPVRRMRKLSDQAA